MEAAEDIVNEIETLKANLTTIERQYKDSIATTVTLDEELIKKSETLNVVMLLAANKGSFLRLFTCGATCN
jgi:flagellar hook-associated protein FlgK